METGDYRYFSVTDDAYHSHPPMVTFKLLLYPDVVTLASSRPGTPSPCTPMYIYEAINILVDIRRFPDPGAHIEEALVEAQRIATNFMSHWLTTPQLGLQIGEVQTTDGPACFYWKAKLSCMAASKIFPYYSTDGGFIVVKTHSSVWMMYPWDQVEELIQILEGIPTPPNTPAVGAESLDGE